MSKIRYPSSISRDFSPSVLEEVKKICSKPLPEIYQICTNLLPPRPPSKVNLFEILRFILEQKITPENASLIGWFAINNIIPTPTLSLYLKSLLEMKETYYGEQCCIAFAQEVMLFGYKFSSFLDEVSLIPGFSYRHPDLYISINQILENPVSIDAFLSKTQYSIPNPPRKFNIPQNPRLKLLPIAKSPNEPPLKQTMNECVQCAYLMPEEYRRHYLISFILNSPIPDQIKDAPNVLLEAVCVYAKHLLSNAIHDKLSKWERYNYHRQLHLVGMWIGLLSISQGPPPPVFYIDFHLLLRESIKLGCFHEVVILLTGYFSRASPIYQLPCPYTSSILEIMSAVVHHPGIRLDIIQSVANLALMLRTNINYFFNRTVDIDLHSPEMHSVFQLSQETQSYYLAPYKVDSNVSIDSMRVYNFFNYSPKVESLPNILKEVVRKAEYVRKYYFVGHGNAVGIPYNIGIDQGKMIDYTMSMALSTNPVLANTASRILYKLLVPSHKLDNNKLRYAFPNHDIFLACYKANCLNPKDINSIFCEILTTPEVGPVALPLIQRMMPHIHKLARAYPKANFTSLYVLSGMQPPMDDSRLPSPDHAHIPLLRYFINYCKYGDDNSKLEFINKFTPGTPQQVTALILLVIATISENSDDYTAIDCYATIIPSLPKKILNDALISGLIKALEALTPTMVITHQKAIFRVAYESFSAIEDCHPSKLLNLFRQYSPGKIPGFAASWMQLVLHPNIFPVLINSNDPGNTIFCLQFLITIIKLAVNIPNGFYRPVARILFTVCDQFPLFVASYHCFLIEHIPPRFVQLRNIILNADPHTDAMLPPPIGVLIPDTPNMKVLKMKAEPFIKDMTLQSTNSSITAIIDIIKTDVQTDPSIIWKFVLTVINSFTHGRQQVSAKSQVVELFYKLILFSPVFIGALFDHVRFSNTHTKFVMELLLILYGKFQDDYREVFLIELVRRLLCVTQPPQTLVRLFVRLWEERNAEITLLAKKRNETKQLQEIFDTITVLQRQYQQMHKKSKQPPTVINSL